MCSCLCSLPLSLPAQYVRKLKTRHRESGIHLFLLKKKEYFFITATSHIYMLRMNVEEKRRKEKSYNISAYPERKL